MCTLKDNIVEKHENKSKVKGKKTNEEYLEGAHIEFYFILSFHNQTNISGNENCRQCQTKRKKINTENKINDGKSDKVK